MAKIVKLHHNIDLSNSGGIMGAEGVFWGGNALQTITIARHTPFNPQQAVGYKGIVDYTSSPVTSDLTLDCILTEQSASATQGSSIYKHAETEVTIGAESYVLTSCALNFQAGNPATVNYGYITAGLASELLATANPTVLQDGEEAAFAVVMGEDGKGVKIVALKKDGTAFVVPAGVQTIGFNSSFNRNQILDVRSSSPVQFVTTYPLDITANLEMLQKISGNDLGSLEILPGSNTEGLVTTAKGNRTPAKGGSAGACASFVKATGLMMTENGENISVGGNLTYTYSFTAADLLLPLEEPDSSGSASE